MFLLFLIYSYTGSVETWILGSCLPFAVKNTIGGYVIDLMTCFYAIYVHVLCNYYAVCNKTLIDWLYSGDSIRLFFPSGLRVTHEIGRFVGDSQSLGANRRMLSPSQPVNQCSLVCIYYIEELQIELFRRTVHGQAMISQKHC